MFKSLNPSKKLEKKECDIHTELTVPKMLISALGSWGVT